MAEEIIYEWEHPTDLVLEAMNGVHPGEQRTPHKLWSVLADPNITASHKFRLIGADGKEVVFPLKLVSDTSIQSRVED